MSQLDDTPDSDIDEPRISDDTLEDEDPRCSVCGEPAEYDVTHIVADDKVVRVIKTPTRWDDMDTGDGPLCEEHYAQTATAAYWDSYQRAEDRAQEYRAGID